jgi:predicted DNA-binding antitoxin AbrB/MazE fold protein
MHPFSVTAAHTRSSESQSLDLSGRRIHAPTPHGARTPHSERWGGAARPSSLKRYTCRNAMGIKVSYKDGVFEPLEKVEDAKPGTVYTVFSDEELRDIREAVGWLKAAEKSFDFWNNPADAVYDTL